MMRKQLTYYCIDCGPSQDTEQGLLGKLASPSLCCSRRLRDSHRLLHALREALPPWSPHVCAAGQEQLRVQVGRARLTKRAVARLKEPSRREAVCRARSPPEPPAASDASTAEAQHVATGAEQAGAASTAPAVPDANPASVASATPADVADAPAGLPAGPAAT